jgi:hypothetical protein
MRRNVHGNFHGLFSYAFIFFPGTHEEYCKNVSVTTLNVWVKFGTGFIISELQAQQVTTANKQLSRFGHVRK